VLRVVGKWKDIENCIITSSDVLKISLSILDVVLVTGLVGNPRAVAVLETLAAFSIAPVPGDVTTQPTGVSRIGSLDGRLVVYRDTFETRDQLSSVTRVHPNMILV
jgi:hypothetical protein